MQRSRCSKNMKVRWPQVLVDDGTGGRKSGIQLHPIIAGIVHLIALALITIYHLTDHSTEAIYLPVLRVFKGKLLSFENPDTRNTELASLTPQAAWSKWVPGIFFRFCCGHLKLPCHFVQSLKHPPNQITGHENLKQFRLQCKNLENLVEFTVEAVVAPPYRVAGGVKFPPEVLAAWFFVIVAVEPLPCLKIKWTLIMQIYICHDCLQ